MHVATNFTNVANLCNIFLIFYDYLNFCYFTIFVVAVENFITSNYFKVFNLFKRYNDFHQ